MIYTHLHPDLDALASAWLARRLRGGRDELRFVSAAWPGPVPPGDLAVDIACGVKGRIDPASGRVSSAFGLLLEGPEAAPLRERLAALAELVEAQDTTGRGVDVLAGRGLPESVRAHCLPALIEAARVSLADDRRLFDWASAIFDGLLAAPPSGSPVRWFGRVALAGGGPHAPLFERGARVVVYEEGWNVGAVRAPDQALHLGRLLEPWLRARGQVAGWFFHPAGYLAAHGSRKAPAEAPCAVAAQDLCGFLEREIAGGCPAAASA